MPGTRRRPPCPALTTQLPSASTSRSCPTRRSNRNAEPPALPDPFNRRALRRLCAPKSPNLILQSFVSATSPEGHAAICACCRREPDECLLLRCVQRGRNAGICFPSSNPQTNAVSSPYCATPSARVICVTAPMSPARRSARGLGRARQQREHPSAAPRTDCSNRSARNGRATSYVERIRGSARTAECHTIAMTWAVPNRPLWPRGANRRCRRHRPFRPLPAGLRTTRSDQPGCFCAACRTQSLICSCCDRCQIYCPETAPRAPGTAHNVLRTALPEQPPGTATTHCHPLNQNHSSDRPPPVAEATCWQRVSNKQSCCSIKRPSRGPDLACPPLAAHSGGQSVPRAPPKAARSVLDGREHGGIITADGRHVPEARAVYTRVLTPANGSRVITNAHRINSGQMPELSHDGALSDFYFIEAQAPEDGVNKIISLVRTASRTPSAWTRSAIFRCCAR